MFLATTALSEFWDKEDEILFLGPWCLRYDRQEEWRRLKYTLLPNPWTNVNRIRKAAEYCDEVIEDLLRGLVPLLNEVHSTTHGPRYWRILLGPWLLYYIHALYDRYVHLKTALESFEDARTVCLDPSCFKTPADTIDFVRLAYEESADLHNLQLYGQILSALQRSGPFRKPLRIVLNDSARSYPRSRRLIPVARTMARRIRSCASMVLGRLFSIVPHLAWIHQVHLRGVDVCRLALASGFRFRPIGGALPCLKQNAVRNEDLRERFDILRTRDEFELVLRETLAQNFPRLYLEDYDSFRAACRKLFPKPPKVVFSSGGWYFDEAFKFAAAEYAESGARCVGAQHGGGYGMSALLPQERLEWGMSDAWCSYGWKPGWGSTNVVALPHPRFATVRQKQSNHTRSFASPILFVTTSHPRYLFRFESHPLGTFEDLLQWRSRFVGDLAARARDRLVVRLSGQDYGWCHEQRLVDACGPLAFDYGSRPLQVAMRGVGLVIIEYPGTAMLEALASNVPTLLFWKPETWQFREEAETYIAALRKCGILCDSPARAAARVMKVCESPAEWWELPEIQRARKEFVDQYALWREDWIKGWIQMLNEQVALSRVVER